MANSQKYKLTLQLNADFLNKKVTVVKAVRQLFHMSLRDAKNVVDNFICAFDGGWGLNYYEISLIVTAEQLGTAMALMMLNEQYRGTLKNGNGDTYKQKVFNYSNVEILDTPMAYDISNCGGPRITHPTE